MKADYLPMKLDPVLQSVKDTFRLEEQFKLFLSRNQEAYNSKPDVGFLLFLIENQRFAIINLEERVAVLEALTKPIRVHGSGKEGRPNDS